MLFPNCNVPFRILRAPAPLFALALALPGTAKGQEADPSVEEEAAAVVAPTAQGQTYDPAYFQRFAPRTALDMIDRIPGFLVTGGRGEGRGLGQADQNVLVNGERLSSKSDNARDQLRRIPAEDVVRIEIVDGTSVNVTGLSGQVANVIVDLQGISGSFSWEGRYRETAPGLEWFGGEISVAGTTGDLSFTVALDNPNNRFGSDGPTIVNDRNGSLIQIEDTVFRGKFDKPTISANLDYTFSENVSASLNLSYARNYFRRRADENKTGPLINPSLRAVRFRENGYEYEVSGDLTFQLGNGQLKLIGVETYDSEDFVQTVIETFDDPSSNEIGDRFTRNDGIGERIGRAEYDFPLFGAEWQIAGEAAFNRLDRVSGLFELDPFGKFVEIDFPEGTGGVTEDRYEFSASFSEGLSDQLSIQINAGYEFSALKQLGSAANSRRFRRPKGSASLAWTNAKGLDITLTGERRVGQLSFGDFLARVNLDTENANSGNNELVPSQTWEAQLDINKTLGEWGSTSLMVEKRWIEDFIDLIPLDDGTEADGNISSARRTEIEWTNTIKLDPIGARGVQLDLRLEYEVGEIRDPLTGELRNFSGGNSREAEFEIRHDIPSSDIAYGAALFYELRRPEIRTQEISKSQDGPAFARVYVEHKDLFGLTARATLGNIAGGRDRFERTAFEGRRNASLVSFTEKYRRRIGPIFRLDISGNF